MPSRKVKAQTTSISQSDGQAESSLDAVSSFPFARYTSIVGVHTSLLAFSALLLPTTPTELLLNGFSLAHVPESGTSTRRDVLEVLTESPVRTVAWMCTGAFILQAWWASSVRTWLHESRIQTTATDSAAAANAELTKQKLERRNLGNEKIAALAEAVAFTLAASVLFYVVALLLGAPLISHPLHTYSVGLLLAILTVLPPAYTFGLPSIRSDSSSLVSWFTWIRLFAELSPRTPIERALVYPAVGAVMGSWAGAIPIGLDWERPWQAWPLTPAFGAVGGYIAGSLVALVISATLAFAQVDRDREARQAQQQQAAKKTKKS